MSYQIEPEIGLACSHIFEYFGFGPRDFMFELAGEEYASLRLQIATLKIGRCEHRIYLPHVFTEHGAIMATTLLNSPRATEVSASIQA